MIRRYLGTPTIRLLPKPILVSHRYISISPLLSAVRLARSRPPIRSRRSKHPVTAISQTVGEEEGGVTASPDIEEDLTTCLPSSVEVARDERGVIDTQRNGEAVKTLLGVPALVIARQIEMMNLFLGKYIDFDPCCLLRAPNKI